MLALSLSPFLAEKNNFTLLIYSDKIDAMCVNFIAVEIADESDGGKKRWGSKSEIISTILGMQGEMASHRQVLWSVRLLSAVARKFVPAKQV